MITEVNASKVPGTSDYIDVPKYVGVGSVNIVSVNPDNATLRKWGWNIPEDAEEPKYIVETERDGQKKLSIRVRLLAKVQDLEETPIIAMDYWIGPEIRVNRDGNKCMVIDPYIRTAWATKQEVLDHKVPEYSNGPANISSDYKPCHRGEEEILKFIYRYANITPLQIFDKRSNKYVTSEQLGRKPGRLTIDNWKALCEGNMREIAEYLAVLPNNCLKVIFGIRTTEDNKTYQTFLNTTYIGNGARPDPNTGEYASARNAIDKFFQEHEGAPYTFSASPIKEWKETATEVKDQSDSMFDSTNTVSTESEEDDLPF